MAVTLNRTGPNLPVTVTQDVADLIANTTATMKDKVNTALGRAVEQINAQIRANEAGIDAQITKLQAEKAALPSPVSSL